MDRNIYSFAAQKLATNVKNHLATNVPKMIGRLVYGLFQDRDQALAAKYAIHGWETPKYKIKKGSTETPPAFPILDSDTAEVVRLARQALGMKDGAPLGKAWFRGSDSPRHSVRFLVFANRRLDEAAAVEGAKQPRLCTLVPICGIRHHFVTLDTSSMFGLAKDAGVVGPECTAEAFHDLRNENWRSIIDVDRLRGKDCKFTGTIDTDGIATCVHFTRPKMVTDAGAKTPRSYDPEQYRVLGVDPGRSNMLYMAERLSDGSFRKFVLTRSHYYAESGIKTANKRSARWNESVADHVKELSDASPKGASLPKFMVFLTTWLSVREPLYNEYSKARWAEQRMRLYGGKKRVFAKFLNRVETTREVVDGVSDQRPTVMAYGAAKFAPTGKGELAVPTSRSFKECRTRFEHVLVDEFRTTKTHCGDGTFLQQVGVSSDPKQGGAQGPAEEKWRVSVVRGLLWCGSTSENGKFVNRDMNAAINIWSCVVSAQRPVWLTRTPGLPPLPKQRVVKFITC
jgi:hypothetical protein